MFSELPVAVYGPVGLRGHVGCDRATTRSWGYTTCGDCFSEALDLASRDVLLLLSSNNFDRAFEGASHSFDRRVGPPLDPAEKKSLSERDICTKFITPALVDDSKWDLKTQIREEYTVSKGRVMVLAHGSERGRAGRAFGD